MSVLASTIDADDNLGLGQSDFFSSAWNPDQNDLILAEAFRAAEDYGLYVPQLPQGPVENDDLDYFSMQLDNRLSNSSNYQLVYQLENSQSNADLDHILGATAASPAGKMVSTPKSNTNVDPLLHISRMHAMQNASISAPTREPTSRTTGRRRKAEARAAPAKLVTEFANGSERRTWMRFGQITPVDSPPEDAASNAPEFSTLSESKNQTEQTVYLDTAPKSKKPRKSKKKPLTREQEEARRMKFLERNRVAADKCRQNRKKWIDDLQDKVHHLGADNSAKKAAVEELEQEVVQLKSLLFIHSRQCDEKDVSDWVEEESNKVKIRGQLSSTLSIDDAFPAFGLGLEDGQPSMSRPPSSEGFGSVGDAISRRYSTATVGDDLSMTSGESSRQGSRRPSVA